MGKGKGKASPAPAAKNGSERRNGKAKKKHPHTGNEGRTGRTVGGYSPAKLAARALKRSRRVEPAGE